MARMDVPARFSLENRIPLMSGTSPVVDGGWTAQ